MRTKLGMLAAGLERLLPDGADRSPITDSTRMRREQEIHAAAGVVQKVEWQNPHMRVYVDVTDAGGKVTTWNMEMTSPNTVRRQGWGPKDLLPGEKVTFTTYGGKVVETRGSLVHDQEVETTAASCFDRRRT